MLIALASGILLFYTSMAIGHLFNQHKLLASFGAFVVLNTLTQIVSTTISLMPLNTTFSHITPGPNRLINMLPNPQMAIAYGIFLSGLFCVAYFFIINHILSKRLNLE
jgi:hypothetical protein